MQSPGAWLQALASIRDQLEQLHELSTKLGSITMPFDHDPAGALPLAVSERDDWREYRRLVLAELDRLGRTIKEEIQSVRVMIDDRIGDIKNESIAVLRQEQTNSQLDRLKLWEKVGGLEKQVSQWRGGVAILGVLAGTLVTGIVNFLVNHVWK